MNTPEGKVLIIAGSDSGGGAGIQGDIKTVIALGGFAATAITALTAQNTITVSAIHEVPPSFVKEQIRVVMEDIGIDCVKLGMLHSVGVIEAVEGALKDHAKGVPIVADTVMMAKGGEKLLIDDAVETFRKSILPISTLITPNIPEAEILTNRKISSPFSASEAAKDLLRLGPEAVLMKGGHLNSNKIVDQLFIDEEKFVFENERINTRHTHGTGCSLASACATGIAQGLKIEDAVKKAITYLLEAIRTAPGYGSGHGPVNHGHTFLERC